MPFELIPDTSVPGIIICAHSVIRLQLVKHPGTAAPEWSRVIFTAEGIFDPLLR